MNSKVLFKLIVIPVIILILSGFEIFLCSGADSRVEKLLSDADILIEQKEYAEAQKLIEEALKLDPNSATAYYLSGKIYQAGFKKYSEAIGEYKKALKLRPDFPEVHYNTGSAYYGLGNKIKAIIWIDYARILYMREGKYDKYEDALEILIKITEEPEVKKNYENELAKYRANPGSVITPTEKPVTPTPTPEIIIPVAKTPTPVPTITPEIPTPVPPGPEATPTIIPVILPGTTPTPTIIPIILPD